MAKQTRTPKVVLPDPHPRLNPDGSEPTRKTFSPRVNGPNELSYLLHRIPLDIWERAKAKAAANRPPLKMRWVLIQLIEKFAGPAPKIDPTADPEKTHKATAVKKPRKAKSPAIPHESEPPQAIVVNQPQPPALVAVPDLGDSF